MHRIPLAVLFMLQTAFSQAQQPTRYADNTFKDVTKTRQLYYCNRDSSLVKRRYLDLYLPKDDTVTSRPVIILMHGGGFKFGSKNNSRMKIWGRHFAQRGYVVAAINYRKRKGNPLQRFPDLALSCMTAVEDALLAADFIRQNSVKLGIDSGKIVLGGHSAGAMIALQAVFSSQAEVNILLNAQGAQVIPAVHNPGRIAAVINFWGAIFDTTWLENAKIPIISIHGSRDRVVPYSSGDNHLYGSALIHRSALRSGVPSVLKTYDGFGHELHRHFNPIYSGPYARKRWKEAARFASDHLYKMLNLF